MPEPHNLNNSGDSGFDHGSLDDYRLRFFPLDELEIIRNAQNFGVEWHDYLPGSKYSYLKEEPINLEGMGLTDRQLMAVSLVFYGGLSKKLAARIIKISSQAISDHIKAALKKISQALT